MNISVILNGYKRKNALTEQLSALNNQSTKPSEILLWYNYPGSDDLVNYDVINKIPTAFSNVNLGVWARFAFALNCKSEYICIFDDDTIPGRRWLENCLETMTTHNGLLGTVGLLYQSPIRPIDACSYYDPYIRYGWVNNGIQNETAVEVDLVGHSWFFKKEWLSYYWRELPDSKYNTCGEDQHFSYMLQKYAGIKTYVPPHPKNNVELWGSIKGAEYGGDVNSMWETNQLSNTGVPFKEHMNNFFIEQRQKGWKLVNEK